MGAVERELVGLDPRAGWGMPACGGVFHRPEGVASPPIAFVATHYNLDFASHYLAPYLAERGHGFLGWNTRFCGAEAHFALDAALEDIGRGLRWLRERGAERVVVLGNSGGGSLMAAHQALRGAEEGEGADLYVSVAAHPGRPEVLTSWMDPAVRDESDPVATESELDMYDPANGPPYSAEFVARYREAQRTRNHRITAWARAELERVRAAGFRDRLFTVARTWADPRFTDPALDPSDRPTPACYLGDPARANRGAAGLAATSSLRSWLEMWSLEDSRCRGAEHLEAIGLPALVVQAEEDTGVFPSDARAIHDALACADKRLVALPGDHYFRDADGAAREALADLLDAWVRER